MREFRWPRFHFNWHFHPELELTLIEKGTGLRLVGDSVEEFAEGDFCFLGTNVPHCWVSHTKDWGRGGVCSHVIQFLPDFLGEGFWRAPEAQGIARFIERAKRGLSIEGTFRHTAGERFASLRVHPVESPHRLNALLGLLAELSEHQDCRPLASVDYEPLSGERSGTKLARVLKFIHANLDLEMTQKQVADVIGASPQAFSRFFKNAMGKPYVAYVNELKVYKACRALIESDATVTEIAFASGFNNISNFNEQFRTHKGMTPSAWRRIAFQAASV